MLKDTLKQIRTEMQLGQRDFGLKMHLNARTIWKLERGDLPHPRTLQRLATGLELKPQEMMEDLEWKAWRDRFPGEAVAFLDLKPHLSACADAGYLLVVLVIQKRAWGAKANGGDTFEDIGENGQEWHMTYLPLTVMSICDSTVCKIWKQK